MKIPVRQAINGLQARQKKIIDILTRFQGSALNNKILRISKKDVPSGTGLGLSRGVGEWSSDEVLLESIYKIENFYRYLL